MQKTTKTIILSAILSGLLCVGGQTQSAAKKPVAPPQGVPAAAEKVGDGVWKWKDPQGKSWVYHLTPFGYSRTLDSVDKPAAQGAVPGQEGLRVVEVKPGEVTFEQPTPFGKSRWTRAMADMNAAEKAAYAAHEKPANSAKAEK
jgi:hypothetical protein